MRQITSGVEPDRFPVFGDRLIDLSLVLQGNAQMDMAEIVAGCQPDGLAIRGDCVGEIPLLGHEEIAEVEKGQVIPRIELNGPAIGGDRVSPLALRRQDIAQGIVDRGVVGLKGDRRASSVIAASHWPRCA